MTRKFRFDKLVTNRTVEYSLEEPHTLEIQYRRLGGVSLKRELRRKLVEEAQEIPVGDMVSDDVLDEIADAQNVLDEIKRQYGLDEALVRTHQERRREKKGDFSEGFYVDYVALREDSPWIEYFEADAARYPELPEGETAIVPGEYEHFKGRRYEVLGAGVHSETEEPVVIYRPLYNSSVAFWVLPRDMFVEAIEVDGVTVPRFRRIDEIR